MGLNRFFNLSLDGVQVKRGRCLHRRVVDGCLRQRSDALLNVDEAPELATHEIVKVARGLVVEGLTMYRRRTLKGVLANIHRRRHIRRQLFSRPTVRLLNELKFEVVNSDCPQLWPPEVEDFMPRRRSFAGEEIELVVAVEMILVRPVAELDTFQELFDNVGIACRCGER